MKLMVRCGNRPPFHPTMRLSDTHYAPGHWQLQMFKPGCFPGDATIRDRGLQEEFQEYFKELVRTGHKPI